ncbi:MAG: hypothetical protein LBB16_02770 [Puniceicoccales bacterium]|nr:hypothetical protein [Puniceicoccales bacterium]
MSNYVKTVLWLVLSGSTAVLSYFIHRILSKTKKARDKKNFSDLRYMIGSAIVNMERAIVYEDDFNFRFFARYAIRTCLGMKKAYPPNEPLEKDIHERLTQSRFEESFIEKVLQIYSLESLPDDPKEWKDILKDAYTIIQTLFNRHEK